MPSSAESSAHLARTAGPWVAAAAARVRLRTEPWWLTLTETKKTTPSLRFLSQLK